MLHPLTLMAPPGARPVKVLANGSTPEAFPEEVELEEDAAVAEAGSAEDTAVAFDAESEDTTVAEAESEEDTDVPLEAESEEDMIVAFDVESEEDTSVAEAESAEETPDPCAMMDSAAAGVIIEVVTLGDAVPVLEVRTIWPMSSGSASMKATRGPAIMLLAVARLTGSGCKGCWSEVMKIATGPLTVSGTTHESRGREMEKGWPPTNI